MPWPQPQATAIFMDMKHKKGEAAARAYMRKHQSSSKTKSNAGYEPRRYRGAV